MVRSALREENSVSTRRHTFVRRLGIFVGSVFLLAGAAETIRVVTAGVFGHGVAGLLSPASRPFVIAQV